MIDEGGSKAREEKKARGRGVDDTVRDEMGRHKRGGRVNEIWLYSCRNMNMCNLHQMLPLPFSLLSFSLLSSI